MAKTSVIILSAGSSERMGFPKALLLFDETQTFLEKIMSAYVALPCNEIILVVNKDLNGKIKNSSLALPENLKTVINDKPQFGKFYSVKTGLHALKEKGNCFVQDVDSPFITHRAISILAKYWDENSYVLPRYNLKTGHPVLLGEKVVNAVCNSPSENILLKEFLKPFCRIALEMDSEEVCMNINEQEDYKKFLGENLWKESMLRIKEQFQFTHAEK